MSDILDDLPGRIVVAIDSSREGRALLDFAAGLAASLHRPLVGLFIEDQDILDFADLPIAYEVSLTGGIVRSLTREQMEVHYRSQATLVRRTLETIATRQRIECTFEIRRGKAAPEIGAAVRRLDLVVVGPGSVAAPKFRASDWVARMAVSAASGLLTLAVLRPPAATGPVVAIDTGTELSVPAMRWAEAIARARHVEFEILPSDDDRPLIDRLASLGPSLIAVPAEVEDLIREAISELECPVLVVWPADRSR